MLNTSFSLGFEVSVEFFHAAELCDANCSLKHIQWTLPLVQQ